MQRTSAAQARRRTGAKKPTAMLPHERSGNSKYKPEYCDVVELWGKQGKSKMEMASLLNIDRKTINGWEADYPAFGQSIGRAMAHSQAWWEGKAQGSLGKKHFQAQLWRYSMQGRFKDDYAEQGSNRVDITLDLGGAIAEIEARRRPSDAKPVEVASSFAPLAEPGKPKE